MRDADRLHFVFLASASATVLLLILDARSANPVLPQVMAELTGKAEPEVQQPEFPGGALPESADAGQAYLDETIFVGDSILCGCLPTGLSR